MAFIMDNARDICHPKEINFDSIRNQAAVISREYYDVYPVNTAFSEIDGSPIDFLISGQNSTDFIDLSNSNLYVKIRCKKDSNTNIAVGDEIGLNNCTFHALWQSVNIAFNGQSVVSNQHFYPYKAFLKTFQTLPSPDTFQSQPLFIREFTSLEDDLERGAALKTDYKCEQLLVRVAALDSPIEFESVLKEDVFMSKRWVPGGVDIRINLQRSPTGYILKNSVKPADAPTNLRVVIEEIKFKVCKIKIEPSFLLSFNNNLLKEPYLISYPRTEIQTHYVDKGLTNLLLENISPTRSPNKILVTFKDQASFDGDGSDYIYKFANHGLKSIGVFVNGVPRPSEPLLMDYDNNSYLEAINSHTINSPNDPIQDGIHVNYKDFKNSYAIYCFNLSRLEQDCTELIRNESIRIEAKFKGVRTVTLICIIMLEYSNVMAIDANKQIAFF